MPWRWRALLWGLRRTQLRNNEIALIAAGTAVGVAIGFGVIVIQFLVQRLHELTFAVPHGRHLSEGAPEHDFLTAKLATARFYADNILAEADGLAAQVTRGGESLLALSAEQF